MKLKFKFENVNLRSLNFEEICRFCLSNKGILLSIFKSGKGEHLNDLPNQIRTVLSLKMEEEDGLPSLICHSCLFNVERSLDFKHQCEEADDILRSQLKDEKSNVNEVKDTACQAGLWEVRSDDLQKSADDPVISDKADNDNYQPLNVEKHSDVDATPEVENALQMEESMNDLEESRFGSEPFSLDLCSVRLRSECQGDVGAEDVVLYPSAQHTDEEQWSDSVSENSDELETVEKTKAGSFNNCTACNKAFSSSADLQRHQLIHKQEPPFPCDYCNEEFDEKMLLKAHWRMHAKNKPHMCLTCGEAYVERPDLLKHFAVHDVIKPYHCPGCGKAFAYRSDLRKHAIIHTGVRPFKCPVCSKTFTRSTNLNKHARVHSGRRPYPCDHCNKMFSSRGDLVRHAVIHTGEKPYACLICSLAFNRKDKLSRHERVHMTDRPFVCSECPTSFHRKEELTKHSKFHHFKPMLPLFSILQLEMHMFPAAVLLILLLPLSSNHKIRYYGCFIVYIFLVSCAAVILLPIFLFRPKNVRNCVLTGLLLKHISKLVGIRWELRRGEVLQEERGAVIVANHQSMFDILGMFDFWHVMGKCAAVARKEVFYVWPFGLAAWAAGVVFIDRSKGRRANDQLEVASTLIRNQKTKLWLFPEGTRNRKGDTLLPFKKGAFRVAIACQAPIIPVVYSPYYFMNAEKKYFGQGRIIVQVLDPIPTEGKTELDIDAIMEETRDIMVKQYELLKQEVLTEENLISQKIK